MSATSPRINSQQLALAIRPNDEATFVNFFWGSNTLLQQQLLATLQEKSGSILYVWGNTGSGKSHLLQACCHALNHQETAMYLPLHLLKDWGAESITDLDNQTLICIDDIQAIAGDIVWEEALFHLYNRMKDKESSILILSGHLSPAHMPIQLPDLRSRLGGSLVFQVQDLSDEEKIQVLQRQALQRGFELSSVVAQYLLTRYSRNMHHLYELLQKLDEASLAAHRRVTIPFVKSVFGEFGLTM